MKSIALIPARFAATRLPGKLMKSLGTKTVIRHTYENTRDTLLFDEVMVVTDHPVIFDEIIRNGGYAIMSTGSHESGSDRIAEAIREIDVDIIINVQGDEPFVKKEPLRDLLAVFSYEQTLVASLMCPLTAEEDILNPNYVKVVVDKNDNALYFSRSPIPYQRNKDVRERYMKHIGIYGYRKEVLLKFTHWEKTPLENAEMLEQLRFLENGIPIKMVTTNESPLSIDTEEDLQRANQIINFIEKDITT